MVDLRRHSDRHRDKNSAEHSLKHNKNFPEEHLVLEAELTLDNINRFEPGHKKSRKKS